LSPSHGLTPISPEQRESFRTEGVICLRGAFGEAALALAREAFAWSLAHPSPQACTFEGGEGVFYQDLANPRALPAYRKLLDESPAADLAASLWDAPDVWFMYEQVFRKEGGETRRTPWHQDSSYLPVEGEALAVMWIPFDAIEARDSLEFVPGSHRGVLFDGSSFAAEDDTDPLYGDGRLPRLPAIEKERERWRIVSFAVEPGDVVVFHPRVLHGGAPTHPGCQRRTLSLRFFGADAVYAPRSDAIKRVIGGDDPAVTTVFDRLPERLVPGDPFRDPGFPKLRP
jgi:ectoine hydroxylase-related dioxygenase (phytanoyl-CoA dioxygenase family)